MKRLIFTAVLAVAAVTAMGRDEEPEQRPKVGVVLSGGGAKGVAHIGALKVIEEAGIPIDYIAGTSMGAIVGGLYSIGYDAHTLDSMVRTQNWMGLLTDRVSRQNMSFSSKDNMEKYVLSVPLDREKGIQVPLGLLGGNNVLNLLTELTIGYNDSVDFHKFPIPFSCMAYDMVSGRGVLLEQGNLPVAMRASMSIPGAFRPVRLDGMVLVDGGIYNNFPVDIGRAMGADIIIGVDVTSGLLSEDQLNTLPDLFDQLTSFTGQEMYDKNLKDTDLYIRPGIEPYTAASFTPAAIDTLIRRGEEVARSQWDSLMIIKRMLGIAEDPHPAARKCISVVKDVQINKVTFLIDSDDVVDSRDEQILDKIINIKGNSTITTVELHDAVSKLQGLGTFSAVTYRLDGQPPYDLTFIVRRKSRSALNLGVRFDTEEMAAILLNVNAASKSLQNSMGYFTARLSKNPYLTLGYQFGGETTRKLNASYTFRYNSIDFYTKGHKSSNVDYNIHTVDVNYSNIRLHNFRGTIGLRFQHYDFRDVLNPTPHAFTSESQSYFNYYLSTTYETLDKLNFPTRGLNLNVSYTLYTDNFLTIDGELPFSAINTQLTGAIPVSDRVTILPAFMGRILIRKNVEFPFHNVMGGTEAGRYVDQQLSFIGIRNIENFDRTLLVARTDLRVRMWDKHYASLMLNYGLHENSLFRIFEGDYIFGGGLKYSYDSFIGPISLMLDYSNRSRGMGIYFNLGYYF